MTNTHIKFPATCPECGFSSTDVALLNNHSCDIQANGGHCEDFPCCGHEYGDCNGLKYGSDEAIKSDPHLLCDHENGDCEVYDDDEPEEDEPFGYGGHIWSSDDIPPTIDDNTGFTDRDFI
jgi:hypothetical protein